MTPVDTLIECRWIVPVRPPGAVLQDHALAIDGGRIVAIEPTPHARARLKPARRVVLDEHVLIPGLVNAHTHAAMTLLRGVGDDLALMDWLRNRIWPLEKALADRDFVYDGTRLAALEMLRAGITTCNDMYFFPDAAARAFRDVGMRAVIGLIAIEFPTAYATDADDYLRKGLATRDEFHGDPLLRFALAPHAPYTVADSTLERIGTLAEELDCPIHIHVHETRDEIDHSIAEHGVRPLARLDRLGLVSERLLAVHAVELSPAEIVLLAARGCTVAHCPASNLKLGNGIAPVAPLLQAGAHVAIGTDGAASNNRLDMLEELRLAALLAKGASRDATAAPAARMLQAATLDGARALGLEDELGSIEIGKAADVVALRLDDASVTPCYDVISQLVFAASREHVTDVWVNGVAVVQKQQFNSARETVSAAAILSAAAPWQNRIRQFLNKPLA
ncbi:MAG TPA: TRZ/ATZ family hydrolase [Burkholderiaceae bacterium]|nr:TRZ/ATZ family hydrolase [Burkholderiaceae bacterium]